MTSIPGPMPRTPEWYALRKFDPSRKGRPVVFGATHAAPACGVSPYSTPLDLYCDMMGLGAEQEPTEAMLAGIDFEPVVLNIYERKRKVSLKRDLPMYLSTECWWMGATPDGLKMLEGDKPEWGVDAKTSTWRRIDKEGGDELKFGIEGTDQVPVDILFQAQQQCDVLDLPFVEFPVLFSRDHVPIYRVNRNDDLIQIIRKAEKEMADRLANNDPPEPNWTHENTRELIGLLFETNAESIELDEEEAERWAAVQRRKQEIKEAEELNRAETNRLLWRMQGAGYAKLPLGQKQLKRIIVKPSLVTEQDVEDLRARVGQVKREGYEFLRECKAE